MDVAVLVPIKKFDEAKARLSGVLDRDQRRRLAVWAADRVIAAANGTPVYVVCDDDEVAEYATSRSATVLWHPEVGLNAAVQSAVADLARIGHEHVVVAHSDLPRAGDLRVVAVEGAVTLCPDTRSDGTNVLALPTGTDFTFSYGPGSFRRHLTIATASGRGVAVRHDPFMALDIDTPDDLLHPLVREVLPPWMPTFPANRPSAFRSTAPSTAPVT